MKIAQCTEEDEYYILLKRFCDNQLVNRTVNCNIYNDVTYFQ